ncbi:RNA-directed DNA polymerase [Clostridium beijerinckii]|uniref:group II intron reverse transcriptase/maturase n=1 Tax=Clostridium beijerinckii TaxID=1520 RepID=UPI00149402B4|nr:group II intron reverse transcriptase/maturase [Clostridium beijerinckii]NOW83571.1 RNA-directed DNA polymerase [Clostridium beijerinckii]NOW84238.1 RNA-directed DNA polymerase [Clostridium beijerinckii]NOW84574.1 RNA-directed DNA polymerase [Clostridium beijerinckii]NOW87962.1 RNA-directed DNA polymerase [Clostridium beijerinckii]
MKKYYSLIDKIYNKNNILEAFKRVKKNKGAPGVDGETVEYFQSLLVDKINEIYCELKEGIYKPSPVRRTYIEKDDGTQRPLGIPTVKDRVVQQAVRNIIEPIFEPNFHPSSYGYRPNCSCQKAVAKAERFLNKWELEYVVDMDLSKCFDTLNHELIIKSINEKISDGKVLRLIRTFLESGILEDGAFEETPIGSPQGGVISPLLMNIYMDKFDKKMMEKGIRIVRYADDILVFAKSESEAGRYRTIATNILQNELKLTVNSKKTHITNVYKGVPYLGFIIKRNYISIHPKRIKKFKDKIRDLTPRNSGTNVETLVKELNPVLRGWCNYFKIANCKVLFGNIAGWIRRRLRMKKMKEWKSYKSLHKTLRRNGYKGDFKKIRMWRWRNSASPLLSMALPNSWFDEIKLFDMSEVETKVLYRYY